MTRKLFQLVPRSTPARAGLALAAGGLLAWMGSSDDWNGLVNDGNANTAIGFAAGLVISSALLAMIGLLLAAQKRRRD